MVCIAKDRIMKKVKDIGEIKLIEIFRKTYKCKKNTYLGIGDDAAIIKSPKKDELILFTCDTLVSDVHFILKETTGFDVGWKAMGAGISDIAAMGGYPRNAIVSLALPSYISMDYVNKLIKGMNKAASKFGVDIVGGDTVSSRKETVVTVSVIGTVLKNKLVLRGGAKNGDKILVTGTLGGSIFKKQFNFIPRVKESNWLVGNGRINAMMDITDGLSLDLQRLVTESKSGALLYEKCIPISKDAEKLKNPLAHVMNDGEDFELLFTSSDSVSLLEKWPFKDVKLSVIGEITKQKGRIEIKKGNGKIEAIIPKGYEHFK
jgi:thiamine-monophosphate kinase